MTINKNEYSKISSRAVAGLILAAGKGTRMYSSRPKVLQEILGDPMLGYVYAALEPVVGNELWTVVGFGAEAVAASFPEKAGRFVFQEQQLGTGHALQCAWQQLKESGAAWCLVVNGDTPLMESDDVRCFVDTTISGDNDLAFMTLSLDDPGSYGRVLRKDSGEVAAIIEAKDFDSDLHGPDRGEVNAGIYCLRLATVEALLKSITCDNAQGEFYITQLIDLAQSHGMKVAAVQGGSDEKLLGVNSPQELVRCEEFLRDRIITSLKAKNVIVRQDTSVRVGPRTVFEPGAEVTGPCEVYGASRVKTGARVESHCWIKDTTIASGAWIRSFSHLEGAKVGEGCRVGPYARLRPGAELMPDSSVGNFVEVKNARLMHGVKAGHLSYLGDATIGEHSNIGAGTITCNYDGRKKHQTIIGAEAFIGSNTALVAPVSIGKGVTVGAGSTITRNVPDDTLAIARSKQSNLPKRKR